MLLEKTVKLLLKHRKTISIAESCTGGLLSHSLTNLSGSSRYFKLGLILYSDEAKSKILKIKKQNLKHFTAISKEIAILMAKKVKALAKTNIGIATTGIAGPTGGTMKIPVGTIFIAVAYKNLTLADKFRFSGTRIQIKNKAKNKALLLLKQCLENL